MRSPVVIFFVAFIALFVFVKEIPAQVYKYVDKDGVQHFSDAPTDPKYFSKEFSAETFGSSQDSRSRENELLKQRDDLIRQYAEKVSRILNAPPSKNPLYDAEVLEIYINTLNALTSGQPPEKQKSSPKNNKRQKQLDTVLVPAGPPIHGNESNAICAQTGTFYIGVKGGIINSKTGEFLPGSNATYFSPSTGGFFHR